MTRPIFSEQNVIDKCDAKLRDIVFETDKHWVKRRLTGGYDVYEIGVTHSTRVAIIAYLGEEGLARAKREIERREKGNPT